MAKLARGFAFVLYPESAPDNWRDILDQEHIAWIESPLHCFDLNDTGEPKKPHWHIALTFEGKKSLDQVAEIIAPLNGTIPIALNSVRGMVRYMAHLDNPEKYQYPVDQIIGHGGADVSELLRISASARYQILIKMTNTIRDLGIRNYADFWDYAACHHSADWIPLLADSSSYVIGQYIKGLRDRDQEVQHQ